MRINNKILSIPPYISTAWKNVASLHVESRNTVLILVANLVSGGRIEIPHLDKGIIKAAFTAHASAIEMETTQPRPAKMSEQVFSIGLPIKDEEMGELNDIGPLLQHNPEQMDGPDLPPMLLNKVTSLSRLLGIRDPALIPHPEPHCNCMHCQITSALQKGIDSDETVVQENEEIVSEEDLKFRTWDISKMGDKLYSVNNPLDNQEHYNVYLGDPVGCTCGNPHCEHVRAVLNS